MEQASLIATFLEEVSKTQNLPLDDVIKGFRERKPSDYPEKIITYYLNIQGFPGIIQFGLLLPQLETKIAAITKRIRQATLDLSTLLCYNTVIWIKTKLI